MSLGFRLFAHVATARACRAVATALWVGAAVALFAKGPVHAAALAVAAVAARAMRPGPDPDLDRATGRGGD